MAEFKPNKYQQAVYDFIKEDDGNAVINAVAGSGKSTTIINALNIIDSDKSILFLAFNKSIVDELKRKIGEKPNVQIKTLHSLGSSICYNAFHSTINAEKYTKYINQSIKDKKFKPSKHLDKDSMTNWCRNIRELCNFGRLELETDRISLERVAKKHDILIEDNEIDFAIKSIEWGKMNVAEIDFTDMIYFPNVKKVDIPTFDFVFIDECQDLNAAQREFFLKCVDPDDGRFIAVGDRSQAIYSFAGADAESFDKLTRIPNTKSMPLSVCYRCGKSIIESAKKLVPQIEWKEDSIEGEIKYDCKIDDIKDGDMVVCRTTAPLAKLCMSYIKKGVKAYIKGGDIGKSLATMLKKTNEENTDDAIKHLWSDGDAMIKKICALLDYTEEEAKNTGMYQGFKDRVDTLASLCEGYEKTEDVIQRITDIFSDKNGEGICLSTVHKAKGLECDRVFILDENKFYPPWGMKNEIQAVQEKNLEYVAITRAKSFLGYVYDDENKDKGKYLTS